MYNFFANPARFVSLSKKCEPWLGYSSLVLLLIGTTWGLLFVPQDYQQGDTIRIMYVHVPASWLGLMLYASLAVASAISLIWRHTMAELWGKAIAPIGAVFTLITLVSGSLWGKPMWGTWWVWDARITSFLILFFLYLGYIALWQAFENQTKAGTFASILGFIGIINLPIIKFSVDWWRTMHQPASIMRLDGPTVHSSQLWPLLINAIGITLFAFWLTLKRTRMELAVRKLAIKEASFAQYGTQETQPKPATITRASS